MTSAKCQFHGVGQGLFYSASISDNNQVFNFVYDCGTFYEKDKKLLNKRIDKCFSEKSEIDALFISHFHKDHVSGILELSNRYKTKNVFIPFFF